jgi:hypothetical protein
MNQSGLNFEAGLTVNFPTLESVIASCVYSSRSGLTGVASDLNMSPSELERRLNPESIDTRPLRTKDMFDIIRATGDLRPIYWLTERFTETSEMRQQRAQEALIRLAPAFADLVQAAGMGESLKRKR